jgi:hypothetical protein
MITIQTADLPFPYMTIFSCCSLQCVSVWRNFGVVDCVGLLETETWGASAEREPSVHAQQGSGRRSEQERSIREGY